MTLPDPSPPIRPLKDILTYRLSRLQAKLNAQATRVLRANGGLSLMQWRVLTLIDLYGSSTQAEMIRLTEFDKGLVSRTIKAMLDDGLIAARPHDTDSRQHVVTMTAHGRTIHDRARALMHARRETLLAGLTDQDRAALFRAIARIEANIDTEDDTP
jgi:DNA-binding MarR family transcriptional regulator